MSKKNNKSCETERIMAVEIFCPLTDQLTNSLQLYRQQYCHMKCQYNSTYDYIISWLYIQAHLSAVLWSLSLWCHYIHEELAEHCIKQAYCTLCPHTKLLQVCVATGLLHLFLSFMSSIRLKTSNQLESTLCSKNHKNSQLIQLWKITLLTKKTTESDLLAENENWRALKSTVTLHRFGLGSVLSSKTSSLWLRNVNRRNWSGKIHSLAAVTDKHVAKVHPQSL